MNQRFVRTSKGIINIDAVVAIFQGLSKEGNKQINVFLTGYEYAALTLEGQEMETFLDLIPFLDITAFKPPSDNN